MQIRIGIDVGGTFTDTVAIDANSLELLGHVKIPTSHRAKEGVARGIVDALHRLLGTLRVDPQSVRFISHGTTQATNALLEGDVVTVGVVGIGGGLEGLRARSQTALKPIELAPGKQLRSLHRFLHTSVPLAADAETAVRALEAEGAGVIVASGLYGVDDPSAENTVVDASTRAGLPATGAHEITKLYGLRTRTRTAVVNASILPRMVETADSVERAVAGAGITAPLMIMRGDGGVMSLEQVRRRPILTLMSGPAAGVAGALMFEKVSDGIFLEVGGTSVDISAVRDGRVPVEYATIGGHQTYLQSLDVRSLGIGGGSIVRLRDTNNGVDVGPRSAHIAGLEYSVYQDQALLNGARLTRFQPLAGDSDDYVAVETHAGRFALTLTCAANIAGFVGDDDWAHGNVESARAAFEPLAQTLGCSVDAAARAVLDAAIAKVRPTVEDLARRYRLEAGRFILIGGGGGASTLVPALAQKLGGPFRIARNAHVISPIGVALALVRDVVERMIVNPSAEQIQAVRVEAEDAVVAAGAKRETVEVDVEVDAQRSVVRATAVGALELRARDLLQAEAGEDDLLRAAAESFAAPPAAVELAAHTPQLSIYRYRAGKPSGFLGRFAKPKEALRVVDREGVVRLRVADGTVVTAARDEVPGALRGLLDELTSFGDAGKILPAVHVLVRDKIVDLCGLPDPDVVVSLAADSVKTSDPHEQAVIVAERRA